LGCHKDIPYGRSDQYSVVLVVYIVVVGATLVVAFGMPQGHSLQSIHITNLVFVNNNIEE
jgi:hypothetical protein